MYGLGSQAGSIGCLKRRRFVRIVGKRGARRQSKRFHARAERIRTWLIGCLIDQRRAQAMPFYGTVQVPSSSQPLVAPDKSAAYKNVPFAPA
jgi:hypothetical protein